MKANKMIRFLIVTGCVTLGCVLQVQGNCLAYIHTGFRNHQPNGFPIFAPRQPQNLCPIYDGQDHSVQDALRLCAESHRLVNEIQASLPPVQHEESEVMRTIKFIEEVKNEKDINKLRAQASYWESIGNAAQAQTASLLRERERMGWEAKNNADMEYYSQTGTEFSNSVRPSESGAQQDAYDNCNRVHQIWD